MDLQKEVAAPAVKKIVTQQDWQIASWQSGA